MSCLRYVEQGGIIVTKFYGLYTDSALRVIFCAFLFSWDFNI